MCRLCWPPPPDPTASQQVAGSHRSSTAAPRHRHEERVERRGKEKGGNGIWRPSGGQGEEGRSRWAERRGRDSGARLGSRLPIVAAPSLASCAAARPCPVPRV
ncbi:unnamed protein product [Urochloa humidicola]